MAYAHREFSFLSLSIFPPRKGLRQWKSLLLHIDSLRSTCFAGNSLLLCILELVFTLGLVNPLALRLNIAFLIGLTIIVLGCSPMPMEMLSFLLIILFVTLRVSFNQFTVAAFSWRAAELPPSLVMCIYGEDFEVTE